MNDSNMLDNLVSRVRQGEKQAFRDIIDRTAVVIRAYISFYIDDDDIVEDVVQETFVRVYKEIDRYTLGTSFIAWVKSVAKFEALAERRRRERKDTARARYVQEMRKRVSHAALKKEKANPLEHKLKALKTCLKVLSNNIRKMVTMKYFQGAELSDIAESLKMKISAVGVALHRARAALGECIDKRIADDE